MEDAGDAAGGRISTDASGTLIAWQVGEEEIRVLTPATTAWPCSTPEGYTVTGGPAIRP